MIESTVMIAAWNSADTIERCLDSAASQTDISCEVIVVDDASGDPALDIAQDKGAVTYRLAHNGGPSAARNQAIAMARGEWLAVLDSDDSMVPGRLRRMIDLAQETDADVVLGNFQRVDETGADYEVGAFLEGPDYAEAGVWTLEDFLIRDKALNRGRALGYLKPIIRRDFLDKHGIRYDPNLRNGEDCHLIFECLVAGARVVFSPRPDYLYTVRRGSISHRVDPAHIAALITAEAAFVARNRARFSPAIRALFKQRRREMVRLEGSESVLQALKQHAFATGIARLLRQPQLLPRVFSQLIEATRNRMGV